MSFNKKYLIVWVTDMRKAITEGAYNRANGMLDELIDVAKLNTSIEWDIEKM